MKTRSLPLSISRGLDEAGPDESCATSAIVRPLIAALNVNTSASGSPVRSDRAAWHTRGFLFDGNLIPTTPLQMLICWWRTLGSRAELLAWRTTTTSLC
jgi:hypothetical protein